MQTKDWGKYRREYIKAQRLKAAIKKREKPKTCSKCGNHFKVPLGISWNTTICPRHKLPPFVPVERACKVCETKFMQKRRGVWATCSEPCRRARHNDFARDYAARAYKLRMDAI